MHRKITAGKLEFYVEFRQPDVRVSVKDGVVSLHDDLDDKTPGASFEAIFRNYSKVEVVTGKYDSRGKPLFKIGPLESSSEDDEIDFARTRKIAEIARDRYKAEISGVEVDGVIYQSDRKSVATLYNELVFSQNNSDYSASWKTSSGFVTMDIQKIIKVTNAMKKHIQNCFDKEKDLVDLVNSLSSVDDINEVSWGMA